VERFVKSHDGAVLARLLGLRVRKGRKIIIGYYGKYSYVPGYLVDPSSLSSADLKRLGLLTSAPIADRQF